MSKPLIYAFAICGLMIICPMNVLADSWNYEKNNPDSPAADILLVGNSYTQGNNLASLLGQVISANEESNTTSLTGGGMRFDQHADRMNTQGDQWNTTLQDSNLDWVILQDQSQVPGFPRASQYWQDSLAGLEDLTDRVEQIGAESMLFMTWGYREGDSGNSWRYPDYKTMQGHIRDGYIDYRDNSSSPGNDVWIAPVGLAYESIYDSEVSSGSNPLDANSIFWNLYASDGSHPSTTGSYLTACVMYSAIYGYPTVGNSDSVNINADVKLKLQEAADDTVFNSTSGIISYPWMASDWTGPGDGTSSQSNISDEHLKFGAIQDSLFSVDPDTSFGVTVNLTNNASFDDQVVIYLESTTGWSYNFTSSTNFTLNSNTLDWIYFTIYIPAVVDGNPLSGVPNQWTLKAMSLTNEFTAFYNFSIEVKPWHEIEIVEVGANLTLSPTGNDRLPITIRNVGNIPTKANVTFQIMNDGEPDLNFPLSTRIEYNGWTIALFNDQGIEWIDVGDEITFEVGILAPPETIGDIEVQVVVKNVWGTERAKTTSVNASIEWIRNGTIQLSGFDCNRIVPNESCEGQITISNTGNFDDSFVLELVEAPSWVENPIESVEFSIPRGSDSSETDITLRVNGDCPAFQEGVVSYELKLASTDVVVDSFSIDIDSAAIVNWRLVETNDDADDGRLSVQYIIENNGNSLDGITVVMQVSHGGNQAVIPPEGADYEGELEGLLSFSHNNISTEGRYTFRAWADIPKNEPENGTIWLNMTIRSTLDPEVIIFHSANTSFLGLTYQKDYQEPSSIINWDGIRSSIANTWNAYGYTLVAIIIAGLLIHKSLLRRIRINKEERDRLQNIAEQNRVEKPEDWIKKFDERDSHTIEIPESPEISRDEFVTGFKNISGSPSPSPQPVEDELIDAATNVLDYHEKERMDQDLQAVSKLIDEHVAEPHPANAELPATTVSTNRTERIESTGTVIDSKSVPLPTKDKGVDEELDL